MSDSIQRTPFYLRVQTSKRYYIASVNLDHEPNRPVACLRAHGKRKTDTHGEDVVDKT